MMMMMMMMWWWGLSFFGLFFFPCVFGVLFLWILGLLDILVTTVVSFR
jgi:hypothetical protein